MTIEETLFCVKPASGFAIPGTTNQSPLHVKHFIIKESHLNLMKFFELYFKACTEFYLGNFLVSMYMSRGHFNKDFYERYIVCRECRAPAIYLVSLLFLAPSWMVTKQSFQKSLNHTHLIIIFELNAESLYEWGFTKILFETLTWCVKHLQTFTFFSSSIKFLYIKFSLT